MSIEVKGVSYTYNRKKPNAHLALDDVSFTINDGEFVALVGKTGSGKSTLIQTFNGLILPDSGYVKVDDYIVTGDKKLKKQMLKNAPKLIQEENKKMFMLRKKVGMVFQFPEYQLFSETILKDVMFGPKNFGMKEDEAKAKAEKTLRKVGIPDEYFEKSPFQLSGGEKRRVAIAGILVSEPDILIFDEPTAGLDPKGKKEIMNIIKEIHEAGKTIILVTHDMDIVSDYVDKVFVLNNAKIIEETTPIELFNSPKLNEYSLEIPNLYKLRNSLKKWSSAGFFEKIDSFSDLIDEILRMKNG